MYICEHVEEGRYPFTLILVMHEYEYQSEKMQLAVFSFLGANTWGLGGDQIKKKNGGK